MGMGIPHRQGSIGWVMVTSSFVLSEMALLPPKQNSKFMVILGDSCSIRAAICFGHSFFLRSEFTTRPMKVSGYNRALR